MNNTFKNVLHVIPSTHGGGAEEVAMRIASHQASHFNVHIAYWEAEAPESVGITFHKLRTQIPLLPKPLIIILNLIWLTLRLRPKVVVSHLSYANLLSYFSTLAFRGIRRIMVHHSTTLPNWPASGIRLLKKAYLSPRTMLVAVGVQTQSLLSTALGSDDIATVLPNPLELPKYTPRASDSHGLVRLMAVGRIAPVKNYGFLLQALSDLPAHFVLSIFGQGDVESLMHHINRLGLNSRVTLEGAVSKESLYREFKNFEAFVMTSDLEGQPSSLIEAAASGLATVGRDTPGLGEALSKVGGYRLTGEDTPKNFAKLLEESFDQNHSSKIRRRQGDWIKTHEANIASHAYCELIWSISSRENAHPSGF